MRLRVATLNIWGLPFRLARDLPARRAAIGAALAGLDVDACAFQEVWTAETFDGLRHDASRVGLVHAWPASGTRPPGGLAIVSRLPLGAARFAPFRARGLPERPWHGEHLARKGFAMADVATPEGPVRVVSTHLASQYGRPGKDAYWGLRAAQLVQLAVALRSAPQPLVVLGDLNLGDDQPHHGALLGLAGLRDAALEHGSPAPTLLSSNPYRPASTRDARIDYVLLRDGDARSLRTLRVERVLDAPLPIGKRKGAYSDHTGLRAEVELEASSGGIPDPEPEAVDAARSLLRHGLDVARRRRDRRLAAAALGLGGGTVALLARQDGRLDRRRVLRTLLGSGGSLLGLGGLAALALAAFASPDETAALEHALGELEQL